MEDAADPLEGLFALHAEVDHEAARLEGRHRERLQCRRGCSACCLDDLSVMEVEAERIRRAHPELLRAGAPHPAGACAFLDEDGACRVYEERPQVCRSQGLPLRMFEETEDGEIEERRDICPLNEEGEPLEGLGDDEVWTLGMVELKLIELQAAFGEDGARTKLRDLFES